MKVKFQCPRCRRSYENKEKTDLFCSQFRAILNEEEANREPFLIIFGIFKLTRRCKRVFMGWRGDCAGFKVKQCVN